MAPVDNKVVLELHPLCTLFPRLAGAEFDALKADIVANGQREPITVHQGLVLDGGNRYRACTEAGIEPITNAFTGADPVAFVLSANLHRRHLTPGQQAAIVASAQDWSRAHGAGGDRRSDQAATLPLDSVADRAVQSGASERTQRMADKVARQSPELAKQVAHGEISLPKALEQLAPRAPAVPAPAASAVPAPAAITPAPAEAEQAVEGSAFNADPAGSQAAEEEDHFEKLIEENRQLEHAVVALRGEVERLTQHISLLTREDLASQVDGLVRRADGAELKFDQLAGRNRQLQQTARDAQQTSQYQADLLAKIRAALGVEKNGDILPAITARRAA